jgi:cytochrome b561
MPSRKNTDQYNGVARWLHGISALLVIGLLAVGLWMTGLPLSMQKIQVYALHKAIGITVLTLVILRVLNRAIRGVPQSPVMPLWQIRVATATHYSLLLLLVLMPMSGWVYNSAKGFPLSYFGLFNLPHLGDENPARAELAQQVHEVAAWFLIGLVLLHLAGALYHQFILKDGLMRRMFKWIGGRA